MVTPDSPENAPASTKPRTAAVGAAGVVGGAGISMALFATLHVSDILQNPAYGPTYALVIVFGVAFVVLVAGVLALPEQFVHERGPVIYGGLIILGLLTAAFGAPFVYSAFVHPVVEITASFQPDASGFKDADTSDTAIKLSAKLHNMTDANVGSVGQGIWIDSGRPVTFELVQLPDFEDKYQRKLSELAETKRGAAQMKQQIKALCAHTQAADQPICILVDSTADY